MSAAEVAETTALFPPQQARLRLPRVPGTLPTLPVMACGEKPLINGVLSPGRTASSTGLSAGLSWHRRLPGRSRQQPKLEPLREENKILPINERTASGLNGSNAKIPTGAPTQKKGASKLSPRSRPEDWNKSKKENSELAIRRVKVSQTSGVKNSGKQRMSYPPCTGCGETQSSGLDDLSTVKQTISCPVLCDLDNLTITPKLSVASSPSSKCQLQTDKAMSSRLVIKHQHHKIKQDSSKRYGDLDRLRVPDNRSRQRRPKNSREESRSQRPKPPSWQDLPNEQPTAGASTQDTFTTHAYAVPESVHSVSAYRCDSATTRSTIESERRAVRANIRRTRSRVIDSKEIPKAETVLPLSQTKPSEFNLRKTYHDDTVYLQENAQRCRKWLAALEESDVTPHLSQSERSSSYHVDGQNNAEETVMCDIEISHDKWNFLGSPYPASSDCSSDDQ